MHLCVSIFITLVISVFSGAVSFDMLETDCECGIKNPDMLTRLSGGTFSENHAWPWMVSVVNHTIDDEPVAYCGATLINDRYILTAAHCIPDMMDTGVDNFRIYLGTNYISNDTNFINAGIGKILSHPKFDFETADNDICLIKLDEPVIFTDYIRPICLRQYGFPFVGEPGVISGWGSFNLTEPTENSLKEAEVIVVSNDICAKNYSSVDIPVTDNMLCAALPGEDPCKGDSGGPLLIKDCTGESYNQIGIISHGQGCAIADFPAIFSRVAPFIDWIQENTLDGIYCSGTFS